MFSFCRAEARGKRGGNPFRSFRAEQRPNTNQAPQRVYKSVSDPLLLMVIAAFKRVLRLQKP
jgi:hypothetical protein